MVVEFSIMPVGGGESLSEAVARMMGLIDESGLAYDFGAMGTTLEGEWDEVMGLIKKCRDKMLEQFSRVYLVIKIDERKGRAEQIAGKIKSVEEKLGRRLKS